MRGDAVVLTVRIQDQGAWWDHDVERIAPEPRAKFTGAKATKAEAVETALADVRLLLDND